jgi:hypothetical protein
MNIPKLIRAILDQPEPVVQRLRDFETQEEMEAWYEDHNPVLPSPNLCDDYSREARGLAEVDGYFLACELVADGACYHTQIWDKSEVADHIANLAIVLHGKSGNQECWFMDLNWRELLKLCDFYTGGKY